MLLETSSNLEPTICYWKHRHQVYHKDFFIALRPYWMTYVDFQNTFTKQDYFCVGIYNVLLVIQILYIWYLFYILFSYM
jgi:hypothetical protein